jgi:hypothetical protein
MGRKNALGQKKAKPAKKRPGKKAHVKKVKAQKAKRTGAKKAKRKKAPAQTHFGSMQAEGAAAAPAEPTQMSLPGIADEFEDDGAPDPEGEWNGNPDEEFEDDADEGYF